jgi:hypothetical protein
MSRLILALAALSLAGAARAETPDALRAAAFKGPAQSPLPPGIARTSIERRFDARTEGAFGYLCGRKPDEQTYGAAGARGVDHDGRFLGVKLKMTLR